MPHEAHHIVEALERRGLKPNDIQMIVSSHFHIDHVSNNDLFPQSEIFGSQESYDWCREVYSDLLDQQNWETRILTHYPEIFEHERSKRMMGKLRKLALRWWDSQRWGGSSQFRWIEQCALPADLEGLVTQGHVPGHISVIVHGREERTVIAADTVLSREHDEDVLTMIPHNQMQFQQDRARILAMQARILPGHDLEFSTSSSSREDAFSNP